MTDDSQPGPEPSDLPPPPNGTPAATDAGRQLAQRPFAIAAGVGAVLAILGSVLPWASVSVGDLSTSIGGMDGDGAITLILGLVVGGIAIYAYSRGTGRGIASVAAVVAVLIAIVAIVDIADVNSFGDEFGGIASVSVGIGLWLVLVGGVVGVAGSVGLAVKQRA